MNRLLTTIGILTLIPVLASAGIIYSTDGTGAPGFYPANGSSSTSSVFHSFQFFVAPGQGGVLDQVVLAGLGF